MTREIYTIKDTKTAFMSVYEEVNEAVAKRNFKNGIKNNAGLAADPADYELWRVGKIDDTTGIITPEQTFIVNGMEYSNG